MDLQRDKKKQQQNLEIRNQEIMENQDEKKVFKEKVDPRESQLSDDAIWFDAESSLQTVQCRTLHWH